MRTEPTHVYSMPQGERVRLELAPRLESWNARNHPDQIRLREFVAHVRELIDPIADTIEGSLALQLDVSLWRGICREEPRVADDRRGADVLQNGSAAQRVNGRGTRRVKLPTRPAQQVVERPSCRSYASQPGGVGAGAALGLPSTAGRRLAAHA